MNGPCTDRSLSLVIACSLALHLTLNNDAAAQAFTTRAAFTAALPGAAINNGFDAVAAGTTVASGASAAGVTFTYNFGGQLLKVTAAYPAVSAANALGTADADVFQDGDNLILGFAATNALGLNIITREALENGDLSLAAGGQTASIAAIQVQQTLADGSNVYFLGVVNANTAFTSATLSTVGGGYFFYNLDSFTTARAQDTDNDGISNPVDNCTDVPNGNLVADTGGNSQLDSDGDGYGNICDADLNNSGLTTAVDFSAMRSVINQLSTASALAAAADMDGSGRVTVTDFNRLRARINTAPGPSGLHP